jgi:K+ transport systems, NAD-binding component
MRAIIIGAGQVGSQIAKDLSGEHDVTVLDTDRARIDELNHDLDVLAQEGSGTDAAVLEGIDIDTAEMVIASTDSDETNLVIAGTVKSLADAFTIARVKREGLYRTWERNTNAFGVDFMVCANLRTADEVAKVIDHPSARDVKTFVDETVEMIEVELEEGMELIGMTVAEADEYDPLTFAGILRDGEVKMPKGDMELCVGDHLVLIGPPEAFGTFDAAIREGRGLTGDVIIAGATEIGQKVAQKLSSEHDHIVLIEPDEELATEAAEELAETVVMAADPTDKDVLEETNVGEASVVIATMPSDERNLLVSLLAKRIGVERTIAVIDRQEYLELFEEVGIDQTMNPREIVAEEISRYTRDGPAESIAFLDADRAEVIEITAGDDCQLVGLPLHTYEQEVGARLVVGAIVRDGKYITPRGDAEIAVGDQVVLFLDTADREMIDAVL